MPYSTVEDVRLILKGHYEQAGEYDIEDSQLSNEADILDAIADADSQLDAAIRRRGYSTPLPDPVPDIVKHLSKNIASYLVDLLVRGQQQFQGAEYPFRLRYERARETLRKIETGFIDIYDTGDGPLITGAGSIVINPPALISERDVFPRGTPYVDDRGEFGEVIYTERIPRFPWGN